MMQYEKPHILSVTAAHVAELEAENALLQASNEVIAEDHAALCEQNAKLRELARDLYECGDSCTHCRHWNQGDGFYCDLGVGWKARRMRELEVEVD